MKKFTNYDGFKFFNLFSSSSKKQEEIYTKICKDLESMLQFIPEDI